MEKTAKENDMAEYARTELLFSRGLLNYQGFLFHASAISFRGKAYCFCGPSGTGKSTQTQLWKSVFPNEVQVINDDMPALRLENGVWYAYGTPWSGKTNQTLNVRYPLGAIFMVNQWKENLIQQVDAFNTLLFITGCVQGPLKAEERLKLLPLLDQLMTNVPIWGLRCLPNEEAVWTAYRVIMDEEKKQNETQG